jgi:Flp pilus assembly pilin Flp
MIFSLLPVLGSGVLLATVSTVGNGINGTLYPLENGLF